MNIQTATEERNLVEKRRNEVFSNLVDLLSERRRVLAVVQDTAAISGMQYIASTAEDNEKRMQSQEVVDQSLKVWSNKIPAKGLSSTNPDAKKEAEFKLQQMLKELELKQKQLLKLYQNKE